MKYFLLLHQMKFCFQIQSIMDFNELLIIQYINQKKLLICPCEINFLMF